MENPFTSPSQPIKSRRYLALDLVLRRGRLTLGRRQLALGWVAALAAFLPAVLTAGYAAQRLFIESWSSSAQAAVAISEGETAQPTRSLTSVTWRDENGSIYRAQIDSQTFARFTRERQGSAAAAREEARERVRRQLTADLDPIFAGIAARVPGYADWYFSFTTKYVLMSHALASAATHVVANPPVPFRRGKRPTQSIIRHMTGYMEKQYADRVLRSRSASADIQAALDRTLRTLRADWLAHVAMQQESMRSFILAQAQSPQRLVADEAGQTAVDWDGQGAALGLAHRPAATTHRFRRGFLDLVIDAPHYDGADTGEPNEHDGDEEDSEEVARVIVNLFDKVVDPIASEVASLAVGFAAGGAAVSAAASPPAAAFIGIGVALGAEMLSNRLEESLTRGEFERALLKTIEAMRRDIEAAMVVVFDRYIDRWIDAGGGRLAAE